jgi:hypothetical protein
VAGVAVRLYARDDRGGTIYREVRLGGGAKDRASLNTTDRGHAEQLARALARELAARQHAGRLGPLTLGQAVALYSDVRLPQLSAARQAHARQHAAFFLAHFGPDFQLDDLSQSHVDAFAHARRAGLLAGRRGRQRADTPAPPPPSARWHDPAEPRVAGRAAAVGPAA